MKINDLTVKELTLKILNIQQSYLDLVEKAELDIDYIDIDDTPIGDNITSLREDYVVENITFTVENSGIITWKIDCTYDADWPEVYSGKFKMSELSDSENHRHACYLVEKAINDLEFSKQQAKKTLSNYEENMNRLKKYKENLWRK